MHDAEESEMVLRRFKDIIAIVGPVQHMKKTPPGAIRKVRGISQKIANTLKDRL